MRIRAFCAALLCLFCAPHAFAADPAPATAFDLRQWKLQIPGPKEVKDLRDYSSSYFHLTAEKEMRFHLDAAEKGTTPNAHFVRSELRHLPIWDLDADHTLTAEVRVESHLRPDRITMLQIHGITAKGGDAPPLLRIAVNNGDLVAVIKTTNEGDRNDTVLLKRGLKSSPVKVEVSVKARQLQIAVNGQPMVNRSLAFWKWLNYWKAGSYPQATSGTVDVMFRSLSAD